MSFQEVAMGDGTLEVECFGRKLACPVCAQTRFDERQTVLNSRLTEFFGVAWADKKATNYICSQCGYIYWFLPR